MKYYLVVLFLLASSVCQAEIVTVAPQTATLWSQPGGKYVYEVLRVPRYYPFSVLERGTEYLHVRDYQGQVGWVLVNQMSSQKGVVVEVANINVRKGPGSEYLVAFKASQGVTFKVLSEQNGWLQILHENGDRGWVLKSLTWGQ